MISENSKMEVNRFMVNRFIVYTKVDCSVSKMLIIRLYYDIRLDSLCAVADFGNIKLGFQTCFQQVVFSNFRDHLVD